MQVTVDFAIITFKRPASLLRTLLSVQGIDYLPEEFSTGRLIVVDNDPEGTARSTVEAFASDDRTDVVYVVEPRPGISAARNRVLELAGNSSLLAWIDDDETAGDDWPNGLLRTWSRTQAALIGGPVRTTFEETPDSWVVAGQYFDRLEYEDDSVRDWLRAGNLLMDLRQVGSLRFDPSFGLTGGEDIEFSSRAVEAGLDLRWSQAAIVHEHVGLDRTSECWIVRRQHVAQANYVRAIGRVLPIRRVLFRSLVTCIHSSLLAMIAGLRFVARRSTLQRVEAKRHLARFTGTVDGLVATYRT